ncbi:MAG TPA: hypothetical protein VGQ04_20460 [Chitinophagaceae bacterium]|jgi:hypothetical protein|nr:hypothetical protein [Chitinophagaceae bacterium]
MVTKHLTDDEVQLYAIDKLICERRIAEHIHLCEECRSKVEVYQLLITEIKQQPQPAFDFDLSKMVLQQLPSPRTTLANDKALVWIFAFMGIAFLGGAIYIFQSYFYLFEGIRTIFISLIAITAITVLTYLVIEMYKKYEKEMKVLDLY